MKDTKLVKAYCGKTKKHFALEVVKFGSTYKIVNMMELSEKETKMIVSEVKQDTFYTNENLLPCAKCGSRKFSGCRCNKSFNCISKKKYDFQCIYCDEMKLDYSLPSASDLRGMKPGDKLTVAQGKEVKIITFSNVTWTKFDNVQYHPSGAAYNEPKVHVVIADEDIEFHGYNVSQMDEGVYYVIGEQDDFDIECNVDATTIKPHPGGCFYINFGSITAEIDQNGGSFFLDGKCVHRVQARFQMRLSLSECGHYQIFIGGKKVGDTFRRVKGKTKVIFGFKHGPHDCHLLSHAYMRGIKMTQFVQKDNQQSSGHPDRQ